MLLVDSSVWIAHFNGVLTPQTSYLRSRGITIRKSLDSFIATYAIVHRHELLHADADFDPFEVHLGLRVIHA